MFLKPLIKTLFLSSIIFMLLVILGMKFHWVDYLKAPDIDDVEFALPQNSSPIVSDQFVEEKSFDLQIIQSERRSVADNMTKQQVQDACLGLYKKLGLENDEYLEVAVGSCVVSNYKESIQTARNALSIPQAKLQMIEKECKQKINTLRELVDLEKQLFFGVCVSDGKLK